MGLPRYVLTFENKTGDGYNLRLCRDKIGSLYFDFWKSGVGVRADDEVRLNFREVEKLRDHLTKVIDHVSRK